MRIGIFLMALSIAACSSNSLVIDQQKEQIDFLNEENEALQVRLRELDEKMKAGPAEWQVVGTLIADTCFVENTARLNLEGVRQMEVIAKTLQNEFPDATIRIEGLSQKKILSDEVKIRYPSTWELTSARSSMIARHLQWTHEFDPGQVEVVGYGHYRSVDGNVSEEGGPLMGIVRILALE